MKHYKGIWYSFFCPCFATRGTQNAILKCQLSSLVGGLTDITM